MFIIKSPEACRANSELDTYMQIQDPDSWAGTNEYSNGNLSDSSPIKNEGTKKY